MARYQARMRRRRAWYYALLAAVLVAVGSWVGIAWSRGEISHASLHTFAPAPPTIGVEAPTQTQQLAWRTPDRIAIGFPQWGGTVITYSTHSVGGRDARSGKQTWTYTRTDRVVCTAAQLSGTTVAIYALHGNCDEVSAFDSGTGQRRWTRTLDMDGMPINGRPRYQVIPSTLLVYTGDVVYAVDPVTGYNRWTYQRYGCRIGQVALGSAGALISQTCSGLVQCTDVKFCGRGPQLLLRDGSLARDDDSKPNADRIKWNKLGDTAVPVSADNVVSALDPSAGTLQMLDPDNGRQSATVSLTGSTGEPGPTTAAQTDTAEVIWIGGMTYALRPDASTPQWTAATQSPPILSSGAEDETPTLATARITVPTQSGIGILDGNDGTVIQSFTVPPPQPGSLVYSLGTGFLVTSGSGVLAYR